MARALLLVDFENVQQVDLSRLQDDTDAIVFVGASQKAVPIELVASAQRLGARVEWHRVDGNGGNALDFHIACHLGRVLERASHLCCIVLSKDKGFDPLLRQLNTFGLACRRIESLSELDPKAAPIEDPHFKRVLDILGKSEKRARPRKRKTLSQHISAMFQKKLAQSDIDRIVDMLFAKKLISETNGSISYGF